MKRVIIIMLLLVSAFAGCKKEEDFEEYDPYVQLAADEEIIKKYLIDNNLTAQRHSSGVYYIISAPGTGTLTYYNTTRVSVKYTGKFLTGQQFDANTNGITFTLGNLIGGWQIGIPLIQKGGKIRLFVPSGYAYGPDDYGNIPGNSVLDFEIELLDAINP